MNNILVANKASAVSNKTIMMPHHQFLMGGMCQHACMVTSTAQSKLESIHYIILAQQVPKLERIIKVMGLQPLDMIACKLCYTKATCIETHYRLTHFLHLFRL